MWRAILCADAFALPFLDATFGVVVADPPYSGRNRGKKGISYKDAGYVPFAGRDWWHEAMRVLEPSGHLYVFCAIRELSAWLDLSPPVDVIAWFAPNNPALSAYWRRGVGGRAPAWRPIVHWQKEPKALIVWDGLDGPEHTVTGKRLRGAGTFVGPNCFITPAIQSNMHEAEPWPNQLPLTLLTWLLRPHRGARVLDLFSGTGTTYNAAIGLGRDVVAVERSPEALDIVRHRPAQMARP